MIRLGVFVSELHGHIVPGPLLDLDGLAELAEVTEETGIRLAAVHDETAWDKFIFFKPGACIELCQETDRFSVISLWILHGVHKPDAIVQLMKIQEIRRKIIGKGVVTLIEEIAVYMLENQLYLGIGCLDSPAEGGTVCLIGAAVNDDQLSLKKRLHEHFSHIVQVAGQGGGVHGGKDPVDLPGFRKLGIQDFSISQVPLYSMTTWEGS